MTWSETIDERSQREAGISMKTERSAERDRRRVLTAAGHWRVDVIRVKRGGTEGRTTTDVN